MSEAATQSNYSRSILASVVATAMVVPALVPAGFVVQIYYWLAPFWMGSRTWIPYVDEIGYIWFPEMVRGAVVSAIAVASTRYIFKTADLNLVRLIVFTFWTAVILALTVIGVILGGLSLHILVSTALVVGILLGLGHLR